jgi:hypothetical protein
LEKKERIVIQIQKAAFSQFRFPPSPPSPAAVYKLGFRLFRELKAPAFVGVKSGAK